MWNVYCLAIVLVLFETTGKFIQVAEDYTLGPKSGWHKRSFVLFFPENHSAPIAIHGRTNEPLSHETMDVTFDGLDDVPKKAAIDRITNHKQLKDIKALNNSYRRSVPDGQRSVLFVHMNYTDSVPSCDPMCIYHQMYGINVASGTEGTNELFKSVSRNRLTFPASDGAVVSIAMSSAAANLTGCPVESMATKSLEEWSTLSRTIHFGGADVTMPIDPAEFDHIVFYIPQNIGSFQCSWAGTAYVNACNEDTNEYCRAWMRSSLAATLAHELGHNIGLHHASADYSDDRTSIDEYGDESDVMGSALFPISFNAPHLDALGYHDSEKETYFIDNFFACEVKTHTVHLAAVTRDPIASEHRLLKFYRAPSTAEQSDTANYCATSSCDCGSTWKTTLFYSSSLSVQRVEHTFYYVSYRAATTLDAYLDSSLQHKVFVHQYAPSPEAYYVDRTMLVTTLRAGQSWSPATGGFTLTTSNYSTTGATVSFSTDCSVRPSCNDCPSYACSDPVTSSTTQSVASRGKSASDAEQSSASNSEQSSASNSSSSFPPWAIAVIVIGGITALVAVGLYARTINERRFYEMSM